MLNFINSNIENVSVHHIGNKLNDEGLILSKSELNISDNKLRELLLKYFLYPFKTEEFYSFSFTNEDFRLNPLYVFASEIFSNNNDFHKKSVDIAKHLFEVSNHPQIKSGDLFITYFSNAIINEKKTEAIGIFKSDNRQEFLKLDVQNNIFKMHYEDGINIEKLDKGCIIFNLNKKSGYELCIVDKLNKSSEAQFWKENFLMLKPLNNDFNQTKFFLNLAKEYTLHKFPEEFQTSKIDQIDILNRSIEYFKSHEQFDKNEFKRTVFNDTGVIKSFNNFEQSRYENNNSFVVEDNFEISNSAVKNQAKVFKSVLKLDNNFHIYIHGNKNLIEKGIDKDGRKYYKIYFENEE